MNWRKITVAVCCAIVAVSAFANDRERNSEILETANKEEIDTFLQRAVDTYSIPGLSVCVVDGGGVTYSFNSGEGITSESQFYLGSTSKMFTALAVMRLVEQGLIDLDTPVKNYLPDFEIHNKEYELKITVRHLLNHRSGLSGKGLNALLLGLASLDDEMKEIRACEPIHAPGSHYEYFNSNYRVLGLLVERVSGMSFADFMDAEIFRALGMPHSTAGRNATPVGAHGQLLGFSIDRKQTAPLGAVPSGYVISTTGDIARFLTEELRAAKTDSALLSRRTVLQTWMPSDTTNHSYAMGWLAVRDSLDNKFLIHGGSLTGYQSFFYLNPDKNVGFAVLMNQGGLFPTMGLNTIRDGLISIINGQKPNDGLGKISVAIATTVLLLVAALYVFRIIRLIRRPKLGILRKISFYSDIGIALFIAVGFVPLVNHIMGERADWRMLWELIPEFVILLAMICFGNIVCAGIKLAQRHNKMHTDAVILESKH